MQDPLATALNLHQAGELHSAARLYEKVLIKETDNATALHMLGVLHHQRGEHVRAVELIGKAVAFRPNIPAFHANLAEAYRAQGQFERAAGCCRTALKLLPDYPEARNNLGLALQGLKQTPEAVEQFRSALQLRPDFAAAHSNLGMSLRELGQLDEALQHFRRAVELDPKFAPAQTNLGQMLLDQGKPEEALPHCEEAVRLQPDVAVLHHNRGAVLRGLGKLMEARTAYLEALRLDPNLGRAHDQLGQVLQQEGQLGDALPWLKQAVELEPENANYCRHLAKLHEEREEFAEAIVCWERVLTLEGEQAGTHDSLGRVLQADGQATEAGEHFRVALKLEPAWAPAHLSMGGLHEELGEMAEAERCFRRAIELQPTFALPHARLATLLRGRLPDLERHALEERLADQTVEPGPRARLLFALAHVADARGEHARVAECLRQGNALALAAAQGRREYSPAEHERFVDNLVRVFDRDYFARFALGGSSTRRPVFVFGLPRSGTTLIEQILASHSRIHGAGELRLARQSWEAIPAALGRSDLPIHCATALDPSVLMHLAEQHDGKLRSLGATAERVVDKMPDNYLYLGFLSVLFPNAVYIHCRRDLRDVALSCWLTDFASIRWANDVGHLKARLLQYRRLMDHWREVLPVPMLEVDYEETVADLETVARRLVAKCNLDWEPACLEFYRTNRPVRTASLTQVRQPIYQKSVGRWKNYQTELADLFDGLPLEVERSQQAVRH